MQSVYAESMMFAQLTPPPRPGSNRRSVIPYAWRLPLRIPLLLAVVLFAALGSLAPAADLPSGEQTALVKKYCAVCHSDAANNGGLSLEHYDAARREPALAAMLLSKLNNGAMGAAGISLPANEVQQAWIAATEAQANGSERWSTVRDGGLLRASLVRSVAPRTAKSANRPLYRLTLACDAKSGEGAMQLAWSPEPRTGVTFQVSTDGAAPVAYSVEGEEKMGDGSSSVTGRASLELASRKQMAFPKQSLTVSGLFAGEVVEFPFAGLDAATRSELAPCF